MRPRARALALRRQKQPMPYLPWLVLLSILLAGLTAARAQGPVKPAPDSSGPQMAVPATPPAGSASGHGIAVPPHNVDPGIHLPTPQAGAATSGRGVIAPPGTPGGDPTVVPK